MNVLVIPEDFRKDQYVLKPILRKMMQSLGSKARVRSALGSDQHAEINFRAILVRRSRREPGAWPLRPQDGRR
jgi:hypothetical protein